MSAITKTKPKRSTEATPAKIKLLKQLNKYEYAVQVRVMRNGVNRNKWDFQNLDRHYQSFAGAPILIAYVAGNVGDGHNSEMKTDFATGERYQSFTSATSERPVGYLSTDTKDLWLEEEGGYTWLVAKGIIWRYYAMELVKKIERIGTMDVSAEVNSLEEYDKDGILEITNWDGLGVTILGDHVDPAIPGSNIKKMATYREETEEIRRHVASLAQKGNTNKEPQKIKKGVKKLMAENKTLAKMLAKKFPDFRVLAYSEDGNNVCLMSKDDCEFFSYAFAETDKGEVIADRIKPATLSTTVDVGGETLYVAPVKIYDELSARNNALTAEVEKANQKISELDDKIRKMSEAERARRIKASKAAALAQLNDINASREECEQIEEACINGVIEAAERGDFVECENENCEWVGEEKVCSAVRDIAMQRQIEMDKERLAQRNNAKSKNYVFESIKNNKSAGEDSLEALYNRLNKNKGVNE